MLMFVDLSERITERLLVNKIILREDKELYRYGIRKAFREHFIHGGGYAPLELCRRIPCQTAVRCYFFSILMTSAVLWVMRCVTDSGLICGCLTVISGGMI